MNFRLIKQTAAQRLSAAPGDPYRLTLLHTGAAAALSLVVTVANFLITRQLDSTGGLSGIGTRSVLSTVQTLLTLFSMAVLPFWNMGFLRAALCFARGERTAPTTLLEGFRRWGKVLRLQLLRTLLYILIALACSQLAGTLFMLSPFSLPSTQAMEALLTATDAAAMEAAMEAMLPMLIPMYVILGVVLCAVVIPVFYRLRLADFALMDEAHGALAAMGLSNYSMRGNMWKFFRLDLSFWWYYALQLLAVALAYGDVALEALGVPTGDLGYFIFSIASLLAQVLVTWRFAPCVQTAAATAYDHLRKMPPAKPTVPPAPKNLPWD